MKKNIENYGRYTAKGGVDIGPEAMRHVSGCEMSSARRNGAAAVVELFPRGEMAKKERERERTNTRDRTSSTLLSAISSFSLRFFPSLLLAAHSLFQQRSGCQTSFRANLFLLRLFILRGELTVESCRRDGRLSARLGFGRDGVSCPCARPNSQRERKKNRERKKKSSKQNVGKKRRNRSCDRELKANASAITESSSASRRFFPAQSRSSSKADETFCRSYRGLCA